MDVNTVVDPGKSPSCVYCPYVLFHHVFSMGDLQDPIHWRYLPYIRPIFQA